DAHEDVEVAGGTAVHAGRALARQAHRHAVVDPGRDLDGELALGAPAALAAALLAWALVDLALAMALGARPRHGEEAVAHAHLAAALARVAGHPLGAGLSAGARARLAPLGARDLDLGLHPARRLFEGDLQLV